MVQGAGKDAIRGSVEPASVDEECDGKLFPVKKTRLAQAGVGAC
jgi:hypothetical protein